MKHAELFDAIYDLKGISPIWIHVIDSIESVNGKLPEEALNLLVLYFAFLDEGNICIPLEEKLLFEKWWCKWKGLLLASEKESEISENDFAKIIKAGTESFCSGKVDSLYCVAKNGEGELKGKLFVVSEIDGVKWLFAQKYYEASKVVSKCIHDLFIPSGVKVSEKEKKEVLSYFDSIYTKPSEAEKPVVLNDEQLEAVIRGQKENLFITGGPGTGKTTVVCYLLWMLLNQKEHKNSSVYLAAPSGKAADRLKESIRETLATLEKKGKPLNEAAFNLLNSTAGYTIHRLLNYEPNTNRFSYNKDNQFDEDSIFVIDEASMIDISLFKSLLEAINPKSRIFILGDEYQLPSVQAGAVLGELLGGKPESKVELVKTNRYDDTSKIGALAKSIKEFNAESDLHFNFLEWKDWLKENPEAFGAKYEKGAYPVHYLSSSVTWTEEKTFALELSQKWAEAFYCQNGAFLTELASNLDLMNVDEAYMERLMFLNNNCKILCAEHKGFRGVDFLNYAIKEYLCKKSGFKLSEDEEFFPGELLMITKNQKAYELFNGDNGIVVSFKDDPVQYLMLEKSMGKENEDSRTKEGGIKRIGKFLFYPLNLLPRDSIETAFAITIHKSQGSGYNNILVVIPKQEGHPLLNRQILYTGITRTKGATYILGNEEAMISGIRNKIVRDTKISF